MIVSPNTVLANCLSAAIDLINPRIQLSHSGKVIFSVGTQINGVPHIGTYIVQAASFVMAREVREKFGVDVAVHFTALDNAPYDVISTPYGEYQRMFGQVLTCHELNQMLDVHYIQYFSQLSELTGVNYTWKTYHEQQQENGFRSMFLRTLRKSDELRWCISPSNGVLRVRLPCPACGYAQKQAANTKLIRYDGDSALFSCYCHEHGNYEVLITPDEGEFIDINTMYRNIVKEAQYAESTDALPVMVKGGDWCFSTQPVDWALGVLGYNALQIPVRWFTPQIVTQTGAKLSKSLVRANDSSMLEVPDWLLDMGKFRKNFTNYPEMMVWLIEEFLSHPRHFYRSYSYSEIQHILGGQYETKS